MIEREFEDYLALLRGLLRLRKSQCDAIADELRDHMDARLEDLLAEGIPREKAVQIALEEFGDAAGVGQAFLELNRTNQRRWNMKVTAASLLSCTALGLAAMAFWPDSARHVSNPVMAQVGAGGPGGGTGPMPGMPAQGARTREENNAITAEKLARVQDLAIDGMPLSDVAIMIKQLCGINLIIDKPALENAGVEAEKQLSTDLKDVRIDTALELLLKQINAGYYIHDGIVIITSQEALAGVTEVRVYNVADLVYLDGHWPLDPNQGHGAGGMGGMGGYPGMGTGSPGGMGGPPGMGPGGMGPSGGGRGGMPPGGNPYGGGYGAGSGEDGGRGGPPGGYGGVGGPGGGAPGGIGGPPPGVGSPGPGAGPRGGGKGSPGAGGGVPGGGIPGLPPGSGAAPGSPGPGGVGPGSLNTPDAGSGASDSSDASGAPSPGATPFGMLKSILTAPQEFLAQVGMGAGGGMPGGPGGMTGAGGEGGGGGAMMGGGMGGMGGGMGGPKYFSKDPSKYDPEERRTVDLIDAIIAAVEPESWMATGDGIGEIRPFEGLIVIRNTPKAHQGVEMLLQQIRAARQIPRGGIGGAGRMGGGYGGARGSMGGPDGGGPGFGDPHQSPF